jgi:hypothetical protein
MYTLAAATRRAQLQAAERGEPMYVVELQQGEREEGWSDLAPPTDEQLAERLALLEADEREQREYAADPAAWVASGRLPPWDVMEPIVSAEERPRQTDFVDDLDPVSFDADPGLVVASLLLEDLFIPLLRVAMPDGTLAAVTDQEAEETKILALHGDEARRGKIAFASWQEGSGARPA